jgi:hypothetical protein
MELTLILKKYRKKGWKEQDAEASYSPRFSEFLRR